MKYSGLALAAVGTFLSLASTAAEAQTGPGSGTRVYRGNFRPPVISFENRAGNFRPEYFSGAGARNVGRSTLYFENRAGNFRPEYFSGQSFRRRVVGPRVVGPRTFAINNVDARRFRHRGRVFVNNYYPVYYDPTPYSRVNYDVTPVYAEPAPITVAAQSTPVAPPLLIKVGSICATPDKICKLENAGAIGSDCSCRGDGRVFEGTIRR